MGTYQEEITFLSNNIQFKKNHHEHFVDLSDSLTLHLSLLMGSSHVHFFWRFPESEKNVAFRQSLTGTVTLTMKEKSGKRSFVYTHGLRERLPITHLFQRQVEKVQWEDFEYQFFIQLNIEKPPRPSISYELRYPLTEGVTDGCLELEGHHLYISKGFLRVHSSFFRTLFSKNWDGDIREEFSIKLASMEEIGLMFNTFYPPKVENIEDNQVEQLLELAERFDVPIVKERVAYHLLHESYLEKIKILEIADRNRLPNLIDACLKKYDPSVFAYRKDCTHFERLSAETKDKFNQKIEDAIRRKPFSNWSK